MSITRRECLRLGLGTSALLACDSAIPGFLARASTALAAAGDANVAERILVVVELDGGNDGLNTIVPYGDDAYYRSRPNLSVPPNSILKIDDRVGFAPPLQGFAELLDQQKLAVVQNVGYPNPSRSHFRSMSIWQSGRLEATSATEGWLSRYVDTRNPAGTLDAPAIQIDDAKTAQALSGGEIQAPTLSRLEGLQRQLGINPGVGADEQRAALDAVLGEHRGQPGSMLRFVQQSALVSFASSERLLGVIRNARNRQASYPEVGLARRLAFIAQLVKARLNTLVYYTRLSGFDTHVRQLGQHRALLSELGGSVRAFFGDLKQSGDASRVLMLVFSEFGRRLEENAAAGTDHGTAGPVFLVGGSVRPGLHGPYPNLVDLSDGDPQHAIDFRQVYATVLEKWLNCPAAAVLPGAFEQLPVL